METISLKCIELIQSSGVLVQLDTMISLEDYLGVLGNIYLVSGKFLKGLKCKIENFFIFFVSFFFLIHKLMKSF